MFLHKTILTTDEHGQTQIRDFLICILGLLWERSSDHELNGIIEKLRIKKLLLDNDLDVHRCTQRLLHLFICVYLCASVVK